MAARASYLFFDLPALVTPACIDQDRFVTAIDQVAINGDFEKKGRGDNGDVGSHNHHSFIFST
jgi:hypothetical protein